MVVGLVVGKRILYQQGTLIKSKWCRFQIIVLRKVEWGIVERCYTNTEYENRDSEGTTVPFYAQGVIIRNVECCCLNII